MVCRLPTNSMIIVGRIRDKFSRIYNRSRVAVYVDLFSWYAKTHVNKCNARNVWNKLKQLDELS